MDDRPDAVSRDDTLQPLGICDVAGLPCQTRGCILAHHQCRTAPVVAQIERDAGHARARQDRQGPGPDTSARAGDQDRTVELARVDEEGVCEKVHGAVLLSFCALVAQGRQRASSTILN